MIKPKMKEETCPRCLRKFQLKIPPRTCSKKSWYENGKEVTNFKYQCVCGCSWERTFAGEG